MNNLLLDCIYVFIISTLLIHVGHLIYDIYEKYKNGEPIFPYNKLFTNKNTELNKSENDKQNHSIDSYISDESGNNETKHDKTDKKEDGEDESNVENEKNEEKSKKDIEEPDKIVKNNSLNSLEELNDIKSNLKQMFNDLNKST